MGQHCELMAKEWGISQADQDLLAYQSHKESRSSVRRGLFDDLLVPCAGIRKDNHLRADTSLENLAARKPAFDRKSGKGTLTAGNSTPAHRWCVERAACQRRMGESTWLTGSGLLTYSKTASVDFVAGEATC